MKCLFHTKTTSQVSEKLKMISKHEHENFFQLKVNWNWKCSKNFWLAKIQKSETDGLILDVGLMKCVNEYIYPPQNIS